MHPFINGLATGLIFIFAIGPAFFALIQSTIQYGTKKAIMLALGISVSDTIYVLLVLFGMSKVLESSEVRFWMGIFGAIMLFSFAVYSWFMKPASLEKDAITKTSSYGRQFVKGLFLNGLNPLLIVFWATWVSAITLRYEYDMTEQIQFFAGMLVMILSLDVTKAIISRRLSSFITAPLLIRMNRTVAVILLLFTLRMLYTIFENHP